eukprot:220414-Hanusia_phi.AAC.2
MGEECTIHEGAGGGEGGGEGGKRKRRGGHVVIVHDGTTAVGKHQVRVESIENERPIVYRENLFHGARPVAEVLLALAGKETLSSADYRALCKSLKNELAVSITGCARAADVISAA